MRVIDSKPHRELGKVGMRLWRDVLDTVSLDDTASREVLLLAAATTRCSRSSWRTDRSLPSSSTSWACYRRPSELVLAGRRCRSASMPTKRRPLQHATIGEIRVTKHLLDLYQQWQSELRRGGERRCDDAASILDAKLCDVLGHEPWTDQSVADLHFHQLHLAAYPDPKKRPKRLGGVPWHNRLIDAYERRRAGRSIS
jgi:hypothetical protein